MMMLLTEEEYRRLQYKPCQKCDTICKDIEDKLDAGLADLTQEFLAVLKDSTGGKGFNKPHADRIIAATNKLSQCWKPTPV